MRSAVLVMVAAMACGPSAAEVQNAKTAQYRTAVPTLLETAIHATEDQGYKIAEVDQASGAFITVARFYSPEGDLQSPGAGGFVQMDDRSVQVAFIVKVQQIDGDKDDALVVTVTPKTFQAISGSPKPRELAPDDPNLPPFVKGRADALAIAIHDAAKAYEVK